MPPDNVLSKIHDVNVRSLAEAGSDDLVSVLIQLDLPHPVMSPIESRITPGRRSFMSLPPDPSDGQSFKEFAGFLEQVGVARAHPLEVSNAYSATLPANALHEVTAHPMVLGIDANLRRR